MAEDAIDARIDLFLTELRMPSIRQSFRKIGKQVAQHGGDYVAFLHAVLEEEVNDRRARRVDRRIKDARCRRSSTSQEATTCANEPT